MDSIYHTRLLTLAGNIGRKERLSAPDATAKAHSKLCGSTVTVDINVDDQGFITDYGQEVRACALGQASASVMAANIIGAHSDELRLARQQTYAMLKEGAAPPTGRFADMEALLPVRDYKARHASTLLAFDAVVDALDRIAAKKDATAHV